MVNFDDILECIGGFGRYQLYVWLLCSATLTTAGIQNLLSVFLVATPSHLCHVTELDNLTEAEQHILTTPPGGRGDPSCDIRDVNYSLAAEQYFNNDTSFRNTSNTKTCREWTYDYHLYGTTAVTKWDLVCTKSSLPAVAQSVYMLGFLLGAGVFGFISDRYGRKLSMMVSLCLGVACGVSSAFIPDFWGHAVMRMFAGIMAAGTFTSAFVLYMEVIGLDKRMGPGVAAQVFFSLGYMGLAGVAYLVRSFMWTNFIMSIIPVILIVYWWLLPESPRWLMSQGRVSEAKQVLISAAKMNRVKVNMDDLLQEHINLDDQDPERHSGQKHYTVLNLLATPRLRFRSLNMFFSWFVISMVYYGLSLGVTELAGDPYLNLFLSGLMECASVVATVLVLDRLGRRGCLVFTLVLGGVACIICGLLPLEYSTMRTSLSMIGKFGVSGSFAIIYVFTAEMFPTVIRTIAVGGGSMSARIGGLLAPFIGQLREVWPPLPTLVFGCMAVLAGILSILFPETLGKTLPDTLEEGEAFGRGMVICSFSAEKRPEIDKIKTETSEKMAAVKA